MVTIKDVARVAGVTPATVSNVIRNKGVVAEDTQKRVRSTIKELGYRPNLMARGLVQGRSFNLAMLLSNIANPFYPEIALEAEQRAREAGYQFLLCNTQHDPRVGRAYLSRLHSGLVDGLIVLECGLSTGALDELAAQRAPTVACLWGELFEHEGRKSPVSTIDVDFERAGELAAEHLLSLGHRDCAAVIGAPAASGAGHVYRLRGFRRVLEEAGVPLPDERIGLAEGSVEGGRSTFATMIAGGGAWPTAVFASNDLLAIGVIEAALDAGLAVPGDLSVVGLDDVLMSRHLRPALTTVAVPKRELALKATELVLSLVEDPSQRSASLVLEPTLVVRQSTAGPRGVRTS
jgi:DNA-binding LacI/PurR family transcriptional regulator